MARQYEGSLYRADGKLIDTRAVGSKLAAEKLRQQWQHKYDLTYYVIIRPKEVKDER
jgi:hypothetical protein